MSELLMSSGSLSHTFWSSPLILQNLSFISAISHLAKNLTNYQVLSSMLAGDSTSYLLTSLSFWILGLMSLSSPNQHHKFSLKSIFMTIMASLIISFYSLNVLAFYISFESVMIPMYFLITLYGLNKERLLSATYMFFYTLVGSLPFLGIIMTLNTKSLTFIYLYTSQTQITNYTLLFTLPFLIKLPMFSFHLWLPKAHVEAPISGSMILAGISLKLGGYGLMRFLPIMNTSISFKATILTFGLWGSIMSSLICLREVDMKKIVAYSSVHHSGFSLSSLILSTSWGSIFPLMSSITHGLCSSGLFCMINILYERTHTRNLSLTKGLSTLAPYFSSWFFLSISGNMGAPPFMSFIAEVGLLMNLISWTHLSFPLTSIILFLSINYSLHLFLSVTHGSQYKSSSSPIHLREFHLLSSHLLPVISLIMNIPLSSYIWA